MRKVFRILLVVALIAGIILALAPCARADEGGEVLDILVIGDSKSTSCNNPGQATGWCTDFDTMLNTSNVSHEIHGYAVSGISCHGLQSGFAQHFDAVQPDLVILACGTNDAPNTQAAIDAMGWSWRWMVEYSFVHGAKALPVFIQYSNIDTQDRVGRHWLVIGEPIANDVIYLNMQYYLYSGWFAGIADLQRVPGTPDYLVGGNDGIHPNADGHYAYASIIYRSLREEYNWEDNISEPCGMWGHRSGYVEPSFTPCLVRSYQGS